MNSAGSGKAIANNGNEVPVSKPENKISPELKSAIREFYKNYYEDRYRGDTDEMIIEERVQQEHSRVEGEETFFTRVLDSAEQARRENPDKKITLLFDVDETLVKSRLVSGERRDTPRPTAIPLLQKLQARGFSSGLITSRSELKAQLEDEKTLLPFKSYIDGNMLFSTRGVEVGIIEEKELKDSLPEEFQHMSTGDYQKLKIFADIERENKDTLYIPVDDFKWPSVVLYGIALENNEKFFI